MSALKKTSRDAVELRAMVDDAIAGDRRAREELARRCHKRVRRSVYLSLGPGPDTEDLAQVAMTQVMTHLEGFRGEASFWIWVDRITANAVRAHFRRRRWMVFQRYDDGSEAHRGDLPPRTDDLAETQRALRQLSEHLGELSPTLRQPLVLVLAHGYTVPEVAAILELSFETAKKRIYRGRRELLDRLRDDPYFRRLAREMDP